MSAILTNSAFRIKLSGRGGPGVSEIDPREFDENLLYQAIGRRIRDLRLSRSPKLTQGRLAELLDVERTSVTNIEKGVQRPPISFIYRLAIEFDLPLTELLPPPLDVCVRRLSGSTPMELGVPPKTANLISRLSTRDNKARRIRR